MRYLFIEPKPPNDHVFARIPLPRLGNVWLATILRDLGHSCRVLLEDVRQVTAADIRWADVVGISSTTSTAPRAYALARRAREAGKTVILGGPHVTFLPEEALQHADYVVRGEGEHTMVELARVLDGRLDPDGVAGLSYRRGSQAVHTRARPLIDDLDALPSPDFELVEGWSGKRVTPLSTSRGCPFGCRFCSVIPMFGTRYRFHSVQRVLEDMARLGEQTDHIFIVDDNFAASRKRTRQICEGILSRGLRVEWSAQVRSDAARDPELVRLMAQAGCWCVFVGFESVNPETLEAYNKRQTVDDIRHAVHTFHEAGIRIHGMFVLGADQDDRETIRQTVGFARNLGIETVQFLVLTPTPGTPFFDEMASQGRLLTRDWALYDGHHVVHQPARFTPAELQYEAVRATARFYSLRGALASLPRKDWSCFAIKLYAWRESRRFRRSERPFLRELRRALRRHASAVRQLLPEHPVRQVALPTLDIPEKYRRFLEEFLRRLHLQPVEVAIGAGGLGDPRRAPLRDRTKVVLVPLLGEVPSLPEGLRRAGALWAGRVGDQTVLGLPLAPEHLYRACVELGVALDRRLGAVRRAYRAAAQAASLF
ncbi:MAG: hypothetical protein Kow0092_10670 [Deferrisomatales bacterium]